MVARDAVRRRSLVSNTMKQTAEDAVIHLMKKTGDEEELLAMPVTELENNAMPEMLLRKLHSYVRYVVMRR